MPSAIAGHLYTTAEPNAIARKLIQCQHFLSHISLLKDFATGITLSNFKAAGIKFCSVTWKSHFSKTWKSQNLMQNSVIS